MMDKSWINKPRNTKDYLDGVANFVKLANEKASINGKIYCPCRKCFNRSLFVPEIFEEHLVWNDFLLGYTEWVLNGESLAGTSYEAHHSQDNQSNLGSTNVLDPIGQDAMREMVQDVFGFNFANLEQSSDDDDIENLGESSEGQQANSAFDRSMPSLDKDTTWYRNFLQDCDKELYPGCKNYSKISFLVRLFHIKCLNGWSGKSFSMLLQLLRDAFPEGTSLPSSSYEAKKLIKELGLGYEKIHACENDCMLYWGETANQDFCHVCGSSRWVKNKDNDANLLSKEDDMLSKKKATKVLRYFPLIPRLKRLYMSSKTAASMRWHVEGRTNDGKLRHPADGLAWKSFDSRYPDFASDPRSVRLGLASDGFNPFRTMNSTYSTWPVLLIPYNLPPWLCMKRSSLILSMSKFVLPNSDADKWVLKSLSRKWKNFRFELKAKYMLEDLTEPQLASNVPHGIVPHQWVDLVRYWFSEKCQVYSQIGKASRSLHTTHHTTGSRSFARKRDEFEIEHGREPSRFEFFIETHKRKDGTFDEPSQTIVDNVATKIVEKGGTSESSEATSHLQDEAYTDILGKDRYGRVRGYGIGVTPTQLFGVEAYIRKMGCGGVDSMEMQRFQDQMKSTLKAHEEQMQTMQIKYESQIQTMQKNREEQMEAMHNSYEAKLAGIQSQLDQVTFMLLRFSGSFNNPIAGLAHFGSNIHQVNPSSSNDERVSFEEY